MLDEMTRQNTLEFAIFWNMKIYVKNFRFSFHAIFPNKCPGLYLH